MFLSSIFVYNITNVVHVQVVALFAIIVSYEDK